MGVASQSYLRAGIGVVLGTVLLKERIELPTIAGIMTAIVGVALINWPTTTSEFTIRPIDELNDAPIER